MYRIYNEPFDCTKMEIGDKKIGNVGIADTAASEVLGGDKKESQFATLTTDPSTTVPNEVR